MTKCNVKNLILALLFKRTMKQLFFSLFLSLFAVSAYSQTLLPGSDMPKAVFYKTDGKTYGTDQIAKGKKTLIMFFDATCEHCQRVTAGMSKRVKELNDINLIMVTQDEQRSIDYFMRNYGKPLLTLKNLTILQDKDHIFIPLFYPKLYPALYLYGPDKKLIFWSSSEKEAPKFFNLIK